jgi:hypothetical protein
MELSNLTKMCLNETFSEDRASKPLSDRFSIENHFYTYFSIQQLLPKTQGGVQVEWKHQLLAQAEDVNLVGNKINTTKKNIEIILVACENSC